MIIRFKSATDLRRPDEYKAFEIPCGAEKEVPVSGAKSSKYRSINPESLDRSWTCGSNEAVAEMAAACAV